MVARHGEAVLGLVGDVRSATDMQLAVETATRHFGRLDAVVACAGVLGAGAPLWEVERRGVGRRVVGERARHGRLIEAAAPVLIATVKRRHSRIVAVASAAGHTGLYHLAPYSAAKHAVVGLIRGVAMDLAPYGVTANAVSPGSTRTAILDASAKVYDLESVEEFAAASADRASPRAERDRRGDRVAVLGRVVRGDRRRHRRRWRNDGLLVAVPSQETPERSVGRERLSRG